MLPFDIPAPRGDADLPQWTNKGFRVRGAFVPVLEYSENFAGWSDDLTALHEEAAGDSHPIDVASRTDALDQLRINLSGRTAPVILEIGCSSGFLLKAMVEAFPDAVIVGADIVREPLFELAKQLPSVPLMRFDLLKCPLPSESFDAVVALNVLEHIDDDVTALRQVHRLLRPGGVAIIEVPAGPHLYDTYDHALMHFRRYSMRDLLEKVRVAGFAVVRQSHLGFFLYPAFALTKRSNQKGLDGSVDAKALVRAQAARTSSNRLISLCISLEQALGRKIRYPVGIRCLVVGKKMGNV